MRSIPKPPCLAFRLAGPLPTALCRCWRWPAGASCPGDKGTSCSVTIAHALRCCHGPESPTPARPASEKGCCAEPPPHTHRHTHTQETSPSTRLYSGPPPPPLPRSKAVTRLSPVAQDPSVAWKVPRDRGHWPRLTHGGRWPSFHTSCTLSP